jgi:NAD(P)-dependent dehydrogenase (short-subunit alcohol dehydrogenase family)
MAGTRDAEMQGCTVVITGGNAGIGLATALGLARRGARVLISARDRGRGEAAARTVRDRTGVDVEVVALDLANFASIRRCADEVQRRCPRLDVLINNAGLVQLHRTVTEDGFETTFGVNHLGHFLLTRLLVDRLRASAPARVVVVASHAHRGARGGLDFDDLQAERGYRPLGAYNASKLANIYFARELARRLEGSGVTANALHPGFVGSRLARDGDAGALGDVVMTVARPFALSPERGARTSIYLASSPDVATTTGKYFARRHEVRPSKVATDDDAARRLWTVSEELVASVPEAP